MVKICQTGLLTLNFEIIPRKCIFRFLPKISAGHAWSWKFFFANFQILGPLGCQGWVVIPQNEKKSQNHCTLMYNSLLTKQNNLENCILLYIYRIQLSDTSSNKIRSICSSVFEKGCKYRFVSSTPRSIQKCRWWHVYIFRHSRSIMFSCNGLWRTTARALVFTDARWPIFRHKLWTTLYKNGWKTLNCLNWFNNFCLVTFANN